MSRLTLRLRLLALLFAALAPVLAVSAWRAWNKETEATQEHAQQVTAAAELAVARQREFLDGTQRLLMALANNPDMLRWLEPDVAAPDHAKCEAYFSRLLVGFPGQYSAVVLTDATGVARCASTPAATGTSFADRDVFGLVQKGRGFVVASYTASRLSQATVIPTAVPVIEEGKFRGMLAIGISLDAFAGRGGTPQAEPPAFVTLIDGDGQAIAGSPDGALTLPLAARTAQAIASRDAGFRDYGRNGELYDYRIVPLAPANLVAVAAVPAPRFLAAFAPWIDFLLVLMTSLIAAVAVWIGADHWCLKPLRPIHAFAAAIARGDAGGQLQASGPPELRALADNVATMATAIRNRESELRAGMELRDHMLREIHHRVKNNLQMISSLLSLQGERIRSPRIRRHFADAQNRVLALSILHRHLYERSSWALVDFQLFLNDLVRQLSIDRENSTFSNVRFDIRAPVMAVGPDTAIPVGLIVTEAVSNALRHAFARSESPRVAIHAVESGGEVEFRIEDNGAGFDAQGEEALLNEGLGLTLIRGLAAQLGGEAEITSSVGEGTRVAVRFTLPKQAEAA